MKNILFKLQLVILKSILSENVMGGEGIGGVMWFVRYEHELFLSMLYF